MPTYLCHGFRWHRKDIRPFVVLRDLEDAAPDWLLGRATQTAVLDELYRSMDYLPAPAPAPAQQEAKAGGEDTIAAAPIAAASSGVFSAPRLHPDNDLPPPGPSRVPAAEDAVLRQGLRSAVYLLEEYDPADMGVPCRPYAFVADYAVRVDLSLDVVREMGKYRPVEGEKGWFERMRDEMQAGEEIGWHVVVCGDLERAYPEEEKEEDDDDGDDHEEEEAEEEEEVEEVADDNGDDSSDQGEIQQKKELPRPTRVSSLRPATATTATTSTDATQSRPSTGHGVPLPVRAPPPVPKALSAFPRRQQQPSPPEAAAATIPVPPEPAAASAAPQLKKRKSTRESLKRLFSKREARGRGGIE